MTDAAAGAKPQPSGRAGGRGWWTLLRNTYREMGADHVGLIAAGIAFYALTAIFPGIVVMMAIAGLVMDPGAVQQQLQGLSQFLPQEAAAVVLDQAVSLAGSQEGGLGLAAILGFLIALYSSSKAVQALIEGLNVAFEVEEKRGFIKLYLVTFALTLGIILGFLLIVALLALVPAVLAFLHLGRFGEFMANLLRWPVVVAVVIGCLAMLYRFAPSRGDVPWRWLTPGALAATALWLLGSVAFTVYVANFGSYNETFGALGGVVVLLTWLWLSSFIVLMGAELDSELERQEKQAGGGPAQDGAGPGAPEGQGSGAGHWSAKPPHERSVEEMVAAARRRQ